MNATKFNMTRDINGFNGFGLPFTNTAFSGVLATGVAQFITVPSNYPSWIAVFSYTPGASVWVSDGNVLSPSGAFSSTISQLNPSARLVKAGDSLGFRTPDTAGAAVSVSLYVAPPFGN